MQTDPPDAADKRYYYISKHGEILYAPSLPAGQDSSTHPCHFGHSGHSCDTPRLSRPPSPSPSSKRASSLPPLRLPEPAIDATVHSRARAETHPLINHAPTLGLPKDWLILPLSERHRGSEKQNECASSVRRAFHASHSVSPSSEHRSSEDGLPTRPEPVKPGAIDYTRLFAFELSTESATPTPSYHSRRTSSLDSPCTLPPYSASSPQLKFTSELRDKVTVPLSGAAHHFVRTTTESIDVPFFPELTGKPRLKHARPLPKTFTEQELKEIRRKTRHCIRVVTRTSIGLTSTLALSSVAPQLLIAAAINAYCLGRGALELQEQMQFLKDNELKVKKKDVVIAVVQGVVVKIAFMAITINHDDFVVLAREVLGPHAMGLVDIMQERTIPGFNTLNEWFLKPTERVQEHLGLPTMADRARVSDVALLYGDGGWDSLDIVSLIENIFLVGSIQGTMEHLVDMAHDRLGEATRYVKERLDWKIRLWKRKREEKARERMEIQAHEHEQPEREKREHEHTGDSKAEQSLFAFDSKH